MELEYLGANCIKLSSKKKTFIVDDNLSKFGLKSPAKNDHVMLFTSTDLGRNVEKNNFVIDSPGEYEVANVSITGIPTKNLLNPEADNTVFRFVVDDVRVVIVGNSSPELSDDELEAIGTVDILLIPVGGGGVTLDGINALKVIKAIEPKVVVPTYYSEKGIKYSKELLDLDHALKEIGMELTDTVEKFKLKNMNFSDAMQFIALKRQ